MSLRTQSPVRDKTPPRDDDVVRRARRDIVLDRLLPAYSLLVALWVIAFVEWQWLLGGTRPQPEYTTFVAGLISLYVLLRTLPDLRRLKNPPSDDEGKRATGEYIDRLRGLGFRVFHDLPGDSANVDHVIISTHGVFAIETRMLRRPVDGQGRVHYDGRALSVDGRPADAGPIVQARARATQLRRMLKEQTGADMPVRAVLLFPGWDVDSPEAGRRSEVWVLSPKTLPMWIRHAPEVLHGRDVRQAARRLDTWLRRYC